MSKQLAPATSSGNHASHPSRPFSKRALAASVAGGVVGITGIALLVSSMAAPSTTGDLNGDSKVDNADLMILFTNYGKSGATADLNNDNLVNVYDLSVLLSHYNGTSVSPSPSPTPPPPAPSPTPSTAAITCDQAGIQKVVDSVSTDSLKAIEQELVQDDTKPKPNELVSRWIGAPGNQIKVDWMRDTLKGYGLTAVEQPFNADGYNQNNVIGTLAGSNPNSVYMVSGHIDADSDTHATWAQAADDDASGVAVSIEAARVLKPFQQCLKSSIDFGGLNDEEFTSEGGPVYIKALGSKTFKGEIDLDQIAYDVGQPDCVDNTYYGASNKTALADVLAAANTKYGINLDMPTVTGPKDYGTDGASFWAANLPAIYHEECNKNMPNETTDDNLAHINYSQMTKDAKVVVAGLAELASK